MDLHHIATSPQPAPLNHDKKTPPATNARAADVRHGRPGGVHGVSAI